MVIARPTDTQRKALQRMADTDGLIRRHTGGFWISGTPLMANLGGSYTPTIKVGQSCNDVWCDVRTVRVLERHGWAERTNSFPEEWRDVRRITDIGRRALEDATARKALGWK
jgi:hypothetical protein